MDLSKLWLHAFNLAVKNGYAAEAVKIANEAVDSYDLKFCISMQERPEPINVAPEPIHPEWNWGFNIEKDRWENGEFPDVFVFQQGGKFRFELPYRLSYKYNTPSEAMRAAEANCKEQLAKSTKAAPKLAPERFYWKPVSEFSEGDALVGDDDNYLIVKHSDGRISSVYYKEDLSRTDAVKYLATAPTKAPVADFVPTWEWAKRADTNTWENDTTANIYIAAMGGWFFFFEGNYYRYPTLEAAKLEAERFWRLYVNPERITTTDTTAETNRP